MTCNKSVLLKTAFGLAILLLAAYVALPDFRTWLVSTAPLLLPLLCPLSMLFCMKGMAKPKEPAAVSAAEPGASSSHCRR